jgi:hypothetical protein
MELAATFSTPRGLFATLACGENNVEPDPTLEAVLNEMALGWYQHTVSARMSLKGKSSGFLPSAPVISTTSRLARI